MFFDILPLIIEHMSPLQRLRARTVNHLFYQKAPRRISCELFSDLNILIFHVNKYTQFGSRFKWFVISDLGDLAGLCKEANVFTWRHNYDIPGYLLSKTTQLNVEPDSAIIQYYGGIPICTTKNKITISKCTPLEALDIYIRIWTERLNDPNPVMTLTN